MLTYVIAGCTVVLGCWCIVARMTRHLRTELHTEINRLSSTLRALEEKPRQQTAGDGDPANIASIRIVAEKSARGQRTLPGIRQDAAQISAETQDAIRATLSAFLGRKIQIRSVKPLESHDAAMTWITQGRIAIQASHNQFVSHE